MGVPDFAAGRRPRVLLVSYVEDERIMYGGSLRAAGLDAHSCADPTAARSPPFPGVQMSW
jgi:hypothetical protein